MENLVSLAAYNKHASITRPATHPNLIKNGFVITEVWAVTNLLNKNSGIIDSQKKFWRDTESKIQIRTNKLQVQRFGYLKADLDDGRGKISFKNEKGTDVKLATDLIIFKDIYDVAIIVSGDGDYIPAIAAIKNMGKQVIVVDFKSKLGKLLPCGAKRLKEHCDFSFSLNYNTMYDICRYGLSKKIHLKSSI